MQQSWPQLQLTRSELQRLQMKVYFNFVNFKFVCFLFFFKLNCNKIAFKQQETVNHVVVQLTINLLVPLKVQCIRYCQNLARKKMDIHVLCCKDIEVSMLAR